MSITRPKVPAKPMTPDEIRRGIDSLIAERNRLYSSSVDEESVKSVEPPSVSFAQGHAALTMKLSIIKFSLLWNGCLKKDIPAKDRQRCDELQKNLDIVRRQLGK